MYLNLRYNTRYMHIYLLHMYGLLLDFSPLSLSEVRGSTGFPSNSRVDFFPGSNPSGKLKDSLSFYLCLSFSFSCFFLGFINPISAVNQLSDHRGQSVSHFPKWHYPCPLRPLSTTAPRILSHQQPTLTWRKRTLEF